MPRRLVLAALIALLVAYLLALYSPLTIDDMLLTTAPLLTKLLPSALVLRSPRLSYLASPFSSRNTSFTTTAFTNHNMSANAFLDAVKNRRSVYPLTKKSPIPDSRIKEIVETSLENVPSSFNSQSTRLVVLIKEEHDKFWDTTTQILKSIVPEDQWEHTGGRMKMFAAAYGTVLFYEDPEPVKGLQTKFPQYADKLPPWSEHTSAMHQYVLWTAFEAEGLGANLQHYQPLPDQKAAEIWNIPLEWSLKAQLVFGQPGEGAREQLQAKSFDPPTEKKVAFHGF